MFNSLTVFGPTENGALLYNNSEARGTADYSGMMATSHANAQILFLARL